MPGKKHSNKVKQPVATHAAVPVAAAIITPQTLRKSAITQDKKRAKKVFLPPHAPQVQTWDTSAQCAGAIPSESAHASARHTQAMLAPDTTCDTARCIAHLRRVTKACVVPEVQSRVEHTEMQCGLSGPLTKQNPRSVSERQEFTTAVKPLR
eukprot:6404613-Amphidinium_carterae.1